MDCYRESYLHNKRKKDVFDMYNYVKQYDCCDAVSCNKLAMDIQKAKNLCNDVFSYQHETDEKGNIVGDTLCGKLLTMQKDTQQKLDSYSVGGSRKRRYRKSKKNVRKSKRKCHRRHRKSSKK